MIFGILFFSTLLVLASCQDYENYHSDFYTNNKLLADLRRRDSIPLDDINRQWSKANDYSFQRTSKIRSVPPNNYEVSRLFRFLLLLRTENETIVFRVCVYRDHGNCKRPETKFSLKTIKYTL